MKKLLLLSLTTALTIGISNIAFAHEGEDHAEHHSEAKVVNSAEALTKIKSIATEIDSLIKASNLKSIHEKVEEAETELSVIEKTEVKPEKKARFDSSIKQVKSQLGKVHEASDTGNAEQTTAELNKLNGAIKLLESTIK